MYVDSVTGVCETLSSSRASVVVFRFFSKRSVSRLVGPRREPVASTFFVCIFHSSGICFTFCRTLLSLSKRHRLISEKCLPHCMLIPRQPARMPAIQTGRVPLDVLQQIRILQLRGELNAQNIRQLQTQAGGRAQGGAGTRRTARRGVHVRFAHLRQPRARDGGCT
jgi:hypothetical protein